MNNLKTQTINLQTKMELWQNIPQRLGLSNYKVSNLGNIQTHYGRILNTISTHIYLQIVLRNDDGKLTRYHVHKLVAETFLPNPYRHASNSNIVHINKNTTDNRVENLRFI